VSTSELAAKIEAMEPTDKLTMASLFLQKAKEEKITQESRLAYLRLARGTLSQVVSEIDAVMMYESLRRSTG
jgi:hypothetical protein